MPFERYLQRDEHRRSDSLTPEYNPQPNHALYEDVVHPRPFQFQMPQFMFEGPPTLAPGGGAEVLPPGFFNSPGSMASSWLSNSGFTPKAAEDLYSAPLPSKYVAYNQQDSLSTQTSAGLSNPPVSLPGRLSSSTVSHLQSNPTLYAPNAYSPMQTVPTPSLSTMLGSSTFVHANMGQVMPQFSMSSSLSASSALGLPVYSSSGFDLLSILARVATRTNPKIVLGPVDLSCSFVVVDVRRYDSPIVYASPSFCRLTGYAEHEVLGRNCRFLQAPDGIVGRGEDRRYTSPVAVSYLHKSLVADKECQTSMINYRKDGSAFMNLVTVIPVTGGAGNSPEENEEVIYHVGFQVDLTEQPNAILRKLRDGSYMVNYSANLAIPSTGMVSHARERRHNAYALNAVSQDLKVLLNDEAFLEAVSPTSVSEGKSEWYDGNQTLSLLLLDATPDFLLVLSLKGSFLYVAPSVRRVLGFEPDELVGKSIADYCHPSDVVPLMRELKESSTTTSAASAECQLGVAMYPGLVHSPKSVNLLFRARQKDDQYVWVECRGRLHVEPGKGRKAIILSARVRSMPCLDWAAVPATGPGPGLGGGGGVGDNGDAEAAEQEVWGMLSTGGTVLFMGAGVKSIMGWGVGEVIGMSVADFVTRSRRLLEDALRRAERGGIGKPESVVCGVRRKSGETVELNIVLYPPSPPTSGTRLSQPIVCQFRYAQFAGSSGTPSPSSIAIGNVFEELDTARNSSWQYELQQLKIANQRLMADIDALETTVESQERQWANAQAANESLYASHLPPHLSQPPLQQVHTQPSRYPSHTQAMPHSMAAGPTMHLQHSAHQQQDWGMQLPVVENPLKRRWDIAQHDLS
ncbi:hypothetical protein EW146_g3427 [Bondarzewia mesenterica]|uniref:PAS domain-containing protein n=1 Tax=Bondarzewia mesenterica TaxID=1095465 RepID=A0A4S4LXW1_9AGAM|nr:hypothetical protein EW146_g3427 [Bondarzewia mesenterica]